MVGNGSPLGNRLHVRRALLGYNSVYCSAPEAQQPKSHLYPRSKGHGYGNDAAQR